jgi:hypothetical protein
VFQTILKYEVTIITTKLNETLKKALTLVQWGSVYSSANHCAAAVVPLAGGQ